MGATLLRLNLPGDQEVTMTVKVSKAHMEYLKEESEFWGTSFDHIAEIALAAGIARDIHIADHERQWIADGAPVIEHPCRCGWLPS